ncbi:phage tail protein [Paenibacillus glycinis]|uniref:Phage tail protein n=1 Tax=Paenibacillus glycinis TaxID=2697035 RepID=A0ABW9XID2_9BACL|nr:phage tail protein [Paenibacillus glycinis]NBD22301.1 phage tail protein [Paenibacillus glycinis]
MPTGARQDPLTNFRYQIEIEGLVVGGFSEVSGVQAELETEDYREGGVNGYVHKLVKASKVPNLTFKRGLTSSDTLWTWFQAAKNGQITRRSGSVIMVDAAGEEQWRWNFTNAFPVKWTGPDLKSDSGSVAFESIELVHNGFSKDG